MFKIETRILYGQINNISSMQLVKKIGFFEEIGNVLEARAYTI
jgi:hypothetical protein